MKFLLNTIILLSLLAVTTLALGNCNNIKDSSPPSQETTKTPLNNNLEVSKTNASSKKENDSTLFAKAMDIIINNIIGILISVFIIEWILEYQEKKKWEPVINLFSKEILESCDDLIFLLLPDSFRKEVSDVVKFKYLDYNQKYLPNQNISLISNDKEKEKIIKNFIHQDLIAKKELNSAYNTLNKILSTPTTYEPILIENLIKLENTIKDLIEIIDASIKYKDKDSNPDYNRVIFHSITNAIQLINDVRTKLVNKAT